MECSIKFSTWFMRLVVSFFAILCITFLGVSHVFAAKRVALVIGNSAYVNAAPLKNPRNDAEAITEKLTNLGFEVVGGFDLDYSTMRRKIAQFSKKLRDAEVSVLFYAGHGMQVDGKNYLAPIDTDIQDKGDLDFSTIPMRLIQRQMERETDTVLVFLDACRNNPLARNLRVAGRDIQSRGLTNLEQSATGTLLAFATNPDAVALDGEGKNSPFTTALLKNIENPNMEVNSMLTRVRIEVQKNTKGEQTPWVNSSLLGDFYFNKQAPKQIAALDTSDNKLNDAASTIPGNTGISATREAGDNKQITSMRLEKLAWESVRATDDPDELRYFIEKNGEGFFGGMAKLKLKKLEEKQAKEQKQVELASLQPKRLEELPPLRNNYRPRELTKLVQEELNRIGCGAGRPDGAWGRNSSNALNRFSQHAAVQLASTRPSVELLNQLRVQDGRVCPISCTPKQNLIDGQCIQKTCPAGESLSRNGNCYVPNRTARSNTPGSFLTGRKKLSNDQKQNIGKALGAVVIGVGVCKALGKC